MSENHTCPNCGAAVLRVAHSDGTSYYEPVGEAALDRLAHYLVEYFPGDIYPDESGGGAVDVTIRVLNELRSLRTGG